MNQKLSKIKVVYLLKEITLVFCLKNNFNAICSKHYYSCIHQNNKQVFWGAMVALFFSNVLIYSLSQRKM